VALTDLAVLAGAQAPIGVSPTQTSKPIGGSVKYVYRPGVIVRLTVRLEDWTNDDGVLAQSETKPAKNPAARVIATAASLSALQAVRRASGEFDPAADAQVIAAQKKAARVKGGKTTGTGAAAPVTARPDDHTIQLGVVPLDITVDHNGFRTADKVSLDISLGDLPLPPELVRSLLVEVFVGTVPNDDFGDPLRWVPNILGNPPDFRGYAEQESITADETNLKVSIEALSLEQRLMTLKINPFTKDRRIAKGGEPVTEYIRRLISTIPEFNGSLGDAIGVRMFPNVAPDQIPRLDAALFKRSLQSAQSRAQAGGPVQGGPPPGMDPSQDPSVGQPGGVGFPTPAPAVADVSVWDVITRAAELAGVLPIYDPSIVARDLGGNVTMLGANNILLVPPQTIKETPQDGITIPGGPTDGFSRDLTVGGTSSIHTQVRFLVWGSNIKSYKMTRKYGREKAPRVRVVCHNPDAPAGKRTMTSLFPVKLRGTSVSAIGSGNGVGHAPVEEEVVRVVREIRNQKQLDAIAVALYHAIGRREVTCTIETDELASYIDPTRPETHNENPDLLRLRPGTPCRVLVARRVADPASEGFEVNGLSELMDRRSNPAFLRKALMGGENLIAPGQARAKLEEALSKLETAFQSSRLTDWFYCRNMSWRWSSSDGWSATIELANYVEARNSPANLGVEDATRNDAIKAVKSVSKKDLAAAASLSAQQANLDALITKATLTPTPPDPALARALRGE
jgi:hypothetical protein